MVIDITLNEGSGQRPFEEFARDKLPILARAVFVAAENHRFAAASLAEVVQAAHDEWDRPQGHADEQILGRTLLRVGELQDHDDEAQAELTERASVVAFYGLDWPASKIARCFDIAEDLVVEIIDAADTQQRAMDPDESIRTIVVEQMAAVHPELPDIDVIRQARLERDRRRKRSFLGAGLAVLVVALALVTQVMSRSERVATPEPTPETADSPAQPARGNTFTPEPRPAATPTAEVKESASARPADPGFAPPTVVTTDGDGGFVGIGSTLTEDGPAVILRSGDAIEWLADDRWPVAIDTTEAIDRSGEYFLGWTRDITRGSQFVATVGLTTNFQQWRLLELRLEEPAPQGLVYEHEIVDVVATDQAVLALLATTVEIDFAALQLIEANTCGRTIEPDEVIVKLCNGGRIDVLEFAGIDFLPEPARLFVSTDVRPFDQVQAPFDMAGGMIKAVDGSIVIADARGERLALSVTGWDWLRAPDVNHDFTFSAAVLSSTGDLLAVGRVDDEPPVLLLRRGDSMTTRRLRAIDERLPQGQFESAVAERPGGGWVVYLASESSDWLLVSTDGEWTILPRPAGNVGAPTILPGDDEVMLTWSRRGQVTSTVVIELS